MPADSHFYMWTLLKLRQIYLQACEVKFKNYSLMKRSGCAMPLNKS